MIVPAQGHPRREKSGGRLLKSACDSNSIVVFDREFKTFIPPHFFVAAVQSK
jgi:hypothetical protein